MNPDFAVEQRRLCSRAMGPLHQSVALCIGAERRGGLFEVAPKYHHTALQDTRSSGTVVHLVMGKLVARRISTVELKRSNAIQLVSSSFCLFLHSIFCRLQTLKRDIACFQQLLGIAPQQLFSASNAQTRCQVFPQRGDSDPCRPDRVLQTLKRDSMSTHDQNAILWPYASHDFKRSNAMPSFSTLRDPTAGLPGCSSFKRSNAMSSLPSPVEHLSRSESPDASNAPTRCQVFPRLQAASASCVPYSFHLREVSLEGILLHLSKKGSCVCSSSRARSSMREALLLPTTAGLLDHFIMAFAYANALRRRSLPLPCCSLITSGHT